MDLRRVHGFAILRRSRRSKRAKRQEVASMDRRRFENLFRIFPRFVLLPRPRNAPEFPPGPPPRMLTVELSDRGRVGRGASPTDVASENERGEASCEARTKDRDRESEEKRVGRYERIRSGGTKRPRESKQAHAGPPASGHFGCIRHVAAPSHAKVSNGRLMQRELDAKGRGSAFVSSSTV